METQILEFRKTNHFMFSQWDRSIDDKMLYAILPFVKCNKCEKDVVFVMPSFLNRRGISTDEKNSLILIIKYKLLLTAYWCDHPDYLYSKEAYAHFQILN